MGRSIFRRNHTPPVAESADGVTRAPERKAFGLFKALANKRLWRTTNKTPTYAGEITQLYREVFTPAHPKASLGDFTGRADTIAKITQSIEEEQAHVMLLGRRGLGKTSILNIIAESARSAGYLVARISCTRDLTFDDFLRTVFDDLSRHAAEAAAGDALMRQIGVDRLSDLIDQSQQSVQSALRAFSAISSQRVLIVIDDIHRVRQTSLTDQLHDLLSALSDTGTSASMLIAARDHGEDLPLFGREEAPSGTVAISLDPMPPGEIADILRRGGGRLGVYFGDEALHSIVLLCQGNPVIAQWLGLLITRRVLHRYGESADMQDVVAAASEAANRANPYTSDRLDRATSKGGNAVDVDNVLYLAARAVTGMDETFAPATLNDEAAFLGLPPYPEAKLHSILTHQSKEAEPLLEKLAESGYRRYRFVDPQIPSIIMLRNAYRETPSDGDVLNAYLLHQSLALPRPYTGPDNDFQSWLQFVLTEDESKRVNDPALGSLACMDSFQDRFQAAESADDLATLLQDIREFLDTHGDIDTASPKRFEESAA